MYNSQLCALLHTGLADEKSIAYREELRDGINFPADLEGELVNQGVHDRCWVTRWENTLKLSGRINLARKWWCRGQDLGDHLKDHGQAGFSLPISPMTNELSWDRDDCACNPIFSILASSDQPSTNIPFNKKCWSVSNSRINWVL